MKIIENDKIIFEGKFDIGYVNGDDESNFAEGGQVFTRYNDKVAVNGLSQVLYSLMSKRGWAGNNDEETKLYIFSDFTNQVNYFIQSFCKPSLFTATDFDEEHRAECLEEQEDMLAELKRFGGYEVFTFDLELTDAEKVELLEILMFFAA